MENEKFNFKRKNSLLLAKTLGFSKLQYVASIMQIPNIYIKEVETILFSFIWEGNKVGKVNRNILIQDYGIGGQNMVHVESMIKTQYIMWLYNVVI